MEETHQERHQRHVAEARIRGYVRCYDRTDCLLALFVSLVTWVLLTLFASPVLHPEFWSGVAVASGVRPPDSAASGLGLALMRAVIARTGVENGISLLMQLGHVAGALIAGLSFLLMRGRFSTSLSLKPEELLSLSPYLRALAVAGAVVFACSEALWIRMQFLSDELICLLLGTVAIVAFDRFRRHRRIGWHCLCSFTIGLLAAETPIGFALAFGIWIWNRREKRRYWARKGALKVLVQDPNDPASKPSEERADAVVTFNSGKMDDPAAFFDEELEDEIKQMASVQESWLAVLVFLTGLAVALVIGGRAFSGLGGLAVADRTLWGYPIELIVSWYRQTRALVQPANLFFASVFSLIPFGLAALLVPYATDAKDKFRAVTSLLVVLAGFIAWTQLSPFAGCWFWTWNLGGVEQAPASLRAFMAFFGAAALMAALQVLCCICRRQVLGGRKIMVKEGTALVRMRRFCRYVLALAVVSLVALSVAGRRQPDVRRRLDLIGEYARTFVGQSKGLGWVFTDGAFDDALAIGLRAQGADRPHVLSMMSGRNAYSAYLRTRTAEDDEDRRVLRVGALETLRFWAAERRERLSRVAMQLGFEVLVKCRVTGARSAGLMLRIGTPDDDEAFDQADDASRELCGKALSAAGVTDFGGYDQEVADKFDFILWRLARLSELRMNRFLLKEDGQAAARERELAKRLDTANAPYLKLKAKLERLGNDEHLVLSPQEGLAVALKRGDFNLARPYANRMLRMDSEDLNANFAVGMWAIENRMYGVALKYLETARGKRPDEPSILNNLAMVRFKLGDLDEALQIIEHAARVNPGSKEIQQNLQRIREAVAKGERPEVAQSRSGASPHKGAQGVRVPAQGAGPVRSTPKTNLRLRFACAGGVVVAVILLALGWQFLQPYVERALLPLKRAYNEWAVRGILKRREAQKPDAKGNEESAAEDEAKAKTEDERRKLSSCASLTSGEDTASPLSDQPEKESNLLPTTNCQPPAANDQLTPEAERLWNEAREKPHNFVPDPIEDQGYLSLLYRAAELGHVISLVKLGDYAYRRGTIVEAYYWTLLANLHGAEVKTALEEMRKTWVREGCPPEYENVREGFTEQQGVFARAVLRLRCGIDAAMARKRLAELETAGCKEALLLKSHV